MRLLHYSFALIAAMTLIPLYAHAGAWLQKPGEGLAVLQYTYFTADQFFDDNKNRRDLPKFEKSELNIYTEYGLYEDLTIGTNLYANHVTQDALGAGISERENFGIADTEIFARTKLYEDNKWMVSLQPLIKLPSKYQRSYNLRGGSRSTDIELSALAGINQPIISEKDFIDTRIGYRERNKGLKGQWRMDATVGVYPTDDLLLTVSARGIISKNSNSRNPFRQDGEQDFDLFKLEVGMQYALSEDYWLQLTGFQHVSGSLTGAGEGITIGIGIHF